ncbi:hypothetical protein [Caulobacter sp. UC70_42]|uniref:hypothetical protein n=1 Tax=Caulobacter sp. UC70_42 TaxID=3374551 RepID=UPI003757AF03
MRRTSFLRGGSCLALAIAVSGGMAGAAAAQQKPNDAPTEVEEVVVTGSFIRGTPEDAALPVDVVSAEELQKRGSPSTVELLKALSISNGVLGDTNQLIAEPRARRARARSTCAAWARSAPWCC